MFGVCFHLLGLTTFCCRCFWIHQTFYLNISKQEVVRDENNPDQDDDIDIVLGGAYIPLGMVVNYMDQFNAMRKNGKAILVFENKLH